MRDSLYDRIGTTYAQTRREDPRVAAQILRALGPSGSIINVGAGTGSYEPRDRFVVAGLRELRRVARRQVLLTFEPFEAHRRRVSPAARLHT